MGIDKLLQELNECRNELLQEGKKSADTQKELEAYKKQIETLFDCSPFELLLKDREGRYLKVNKHFESKHFCKIEDIIGKLPTDIFELEIELDSHRQDLSVLNSDPIKSQNKLLTQVDSQSPLTIRFPVSDAQADIDGLYAIAVGIPRESVPESRIRTMVNNIDGILWEANASSFVITFVSQQAERILGYPAEEWYKPGFWVENIHPDDQTWILEYCKKCCRDGLKEYEIEYRYLTKDDKVVWLKSLSSINYANGEAKWLSGITVDITRQKESEQAIKIAEERFRTIFMTAPVGMALNDASKGNLLEVNPSYARIVGRSIEEIKTVGWQAITHPDDLAEDQDLAKELIAGRISQYKLIKRFIKPDKSIVWAELSGNVIDKSIPNQKSYLIVIEDISERKLFEEKIWQQANFDFLTKLPNRYLLQNRLDDLIKEGQRKCVQFSLLLIDLDQFKDVNDTLGHDRGDELLIEAARRINQCIRLTDTVARLGGDEFIILLPHLKTLEELTTISQGIIKILSEPFILGSDIAYVSASIGITSYPTDATDTVNLIKNADQAMYVAKKQGRNRSYFFSKNIQKKNLSRMALIADIRAAIREESFQLFYQPIVELGSGQVYKAEALIRWLHHSKGVVSPAEFIPLSEDTHMIIDIGNWVFEEAARQSLRWKKIFETDFQISINVSPIQFEKPIYNYWRNHLDELGLDGQAINIEITEGLLMNSDDLVFDTLLQFRDAGIQVSLDDFGTGYSSLSYLKKFDIDYLKIDQSFVQNLSSDSDDFILCSAIIVMAHKLGIKVIAEGIETESQMELLKSINCDYGQGYLYSKPVPADEFERAYFKRSISNNIDLEL